MSAGGTGPRPRKRLLVGLALSTLVVLVLAAGAEVVLRQVGVRPWQPLASVPVVTPGSSLFRADPILGYTHLPGAFDITLPDGWSFHVTHLPNTLRITHPLETYPVEPAREELWIFGCSYTHGWSLNDEETYPWLLQERMPEYEIVNFGVGGYGTLHALLQFRQALARTRPRLVVVTYARFHDVRNTFLRNRQKAVVNWNKLGPLVQPFAQLGPDGELQYGMATRVYTEFPLMRHSALSHYLETVWNDLESRREHSDLVSRRLILELDRLARASGTRLAVVFVVRNAEMQAFVSEHGLPNADISVDPKKRENTNKPHDMHPSALANRRYADTLEPFLRAQLVEKTGGTPDRASGAFR